MAVQAPKALYVHIPFCASKCFYCDFNSYVSTEPMMERFVGALEIELELLAKAYSVHILDTVFFGGGTPSLLPPRLIAKVLAAVHRHFPVSPRAEVTLEANPGTVDAKKLDVMLAHGASRISFGAQSLSDERLGALGRLHKANDVLRSAALARAAGFPSMNLDLMFGLPEQSVGEFEETLAGILDAGPDHLSAYSLIIEPDTPFAVWHDRGRLVLPSEEEEALMYTTVRDAAKKAGYEQYEVSNFAKPGHASRHNLVYWRNEPYLAAGPGAHGYVDETRYVNVRSVPKYVEILETRARPVDQTESVTETVAMENTMMLGLRLLDGVPDSHFRALHGRSIRDAYGPQIDRLVGLGLLEWAGENVGLTERGLFVANEVFQEFIDV